MTLRKIVVNDRFRNRFTIVGCLWLASAGLVTSAPAMSGQFTVSPVRIYMAPQDRATAVTLTNEGDVELVMQADIFQWKQKPGGEDDLTLSEDLFLSPPIIKLAPKAKQVVRLAMVRPPKTGPQLTYRMIIREIPEAKPAEKTLQVQIALAFSLPVFITPPGTNANLGCKSERAAPDAINVVCENTGNAYVHPREFVLTNATGEKLASRDAGGYILPGIKRSFEVKRTNGKLPAGKSKLAITLDDGTTQNVDVTLSD